VGYKYFFQVSFVLTWRNLQVIKWSENKKERAERGSQHPIPEIVNGSGPTEHEEMNEDENDTWQVMGARNKSCVTRKTQITKSPISEAFLGQMCSSVFRANSVKSATLQPFYTLQLDIQVPIITYKQTYFY